MSIDILNKQMKVKDFIELFGNDYPLLSEYKNTPQDKEWHSEGDVEIHTNMVLEEVYKIIEQEKELTKNEKEVLILSALFHDYAKPITTTEREINGKVRTVAPKHEGVGASLLFNLNKPLNLSSKDWFTVIQLTAYHHIPKLLVVKNKGKAEYLRLSRQVDNLRLLYLLECADMRGRICEDKQEQLDILELFKLEAQDYGVWGNNPYNNLNKQIKKWFPEKNGDIHDRLENIIKNHYEKRKIFMIEEGEAISYQYLNQNHLVVLCGVPASGKSEYIKSNFNDYHIISLDNIRENVFKSRANQNNNNEVVRIAHGQLREALREKKNIVWDATNYRRDFRDKILKLGFNYGAFCEIIVLQKEKSQLIKDNKNRTHNIPEEDLLHIMNKFQLPELGEADKLSFVLSGEKE